MPPQVTCNARGGQNRNNFRCKTQLFNTRIHKVLLVDACAEVHATGFYGYWLLKEDAVQRPLRMLPASPWRLSNVQSSIVQCPMCIVQYSLSNGQCAICIVQVVELRGVGHLSKSLRRWCASPYQHVAWLLSLTILEALHLASVDQQSVPSTCAFPLKDGVQCTTCLALRWERWEMSKSLKMRVCLTSGWDLRREENHRPRWDNNQHNLARRITDQDDKGWRGWDRKMIRELKIMMQRTEVGFVATDATNGRVKSLPVL